MLNLWQAASETTYGGFWGHAEPIFIAVSIVSPPTAHLNTSKSRNAPHPNQFVLPGFPARERVNGAAPVTG